VVAIGVFDTERALDAMRCVVIEIYVKIEVPLLVAIAEFENVAQSPRVVRIRQVADVQRASAIVARISGKRQQPAPAGLGDRPIFDVAGVRRKKAIVNAVLVDQRFLNGGQVGDIPILKEAKAEYGKLQ
jgi:hypothetical protein